MKLFLISNTKLYGVSKRLQLSSRSIFDIFTICQYLLRIFIIYLQYDSSIEFQFFIILIIYKFELFLKM